MSDAPFCLLPQVFVTAQARTIDLATVLAQGSGLLVLVSPGMKQQLVERLDKYIFPGDQVGMLVFWGSLAPGGSVLVLMSTRHEAQ